MGLWSKTYLSTWYKDKFPAKTSDDDVIKILRKEAEDAISNTENIIRKRIDQQKDENFQKEKYSWDENVSVYNAIDENGKHVSTLMLDPFLRNRKINNIWSYVGRGLNQRM